MKTLKLEALYFSEFVLEDHKKVEGAKSGAEVTGHALQWDCRRTV